MFEQQAARGKFVQTAKPSPDGFSVEQIVGRTPSVMEPKYDGHRILIGVTDQGARVFARSGEEKTGRLPKIEAEALRLLPPGTWIDGEAVCFNADGTQSWGGAQSALGSHSGDQAGRITFVAFDILSVGGTDARPCPLSQRRQVLEAALKDADKALIQVTPQMEASNENYEMLLSLGFEGAITKATDKPYACGRKGYGWSKHKATATADVVVMGFTEGNGSISGLIGAIEYGQVKDGVLTYRGKCSGMTMAERAEISGDREGFVGRVLEMRYQTITDDGSLLFPRYLRFRTDKPAEDCAWDLA